MHEAFVYWKAADTWGWTPEQVDAAPAATLDLMLDIDGIVSKIRAEKRSG